MPTKYFQVSHLVVPFVLLLQVPIFPYFLLSFCIIFPLSDNKLNLNGINPLIRAPKSGKPRVLWTANVLMIILVVIESNADGHQAKRNIIYRLLKRSWRYQTWTHQPLTDSESKLQMNVVHRPLQVKLNPNPRLRVIMSEYFIINILVFLFVQNSVTSMLETKCIAQTKTFFRLDECDITWASTKSTCTNRIRGFSQFRETHMDSYRFPIYAPNVQNK